MPERESLEGRYARYTRALAREPLPHAFVDMDALERNVSTLVERVRRSGKTLRVASKSIRSVHLLKTILAAGAPTTRGVMAYTPSEAAFLARRGIDDVLIAYPTARLDDARVAVEANDDRARVIMSVDCAEHVNVAAQAGRALRVRVPVVIDMDVSYRPLEGRLHVGVRRSPLHHAREVAELAATIVSDPWLELVGLVAYEAHVAGLPDANPSMPWLDPIKRALKRTSSPSVLELRAAIKDELARRRIPVTLFNGGGTGSIEWSAADPSLTEVTAGSGFLDSHLFDNYRGLELDPAIFFALQVTRRPAPGFVTCQGGGLIASGAAGADRLPKPYLPEGLTLTSMEGAGEVQTPLVLREGVKLGLGEPVIFRHAKAGELAEHFLSYSLVRGDGLEGRATTYRGEGHCFG